MKVVTSEITGSELKSMAEAGFGSLVKAIVDVELGIMAVDAELHADQEACLLGQGSAQESLWGINLYPDMPRATPSGRSTSMRSPTPPREAEGTLTAVTRA